MDFSGITPYDGALTQGENGELVYTGNDDLHYAADEVVYPLSEEAFIPEVFATDTEFIESHTLLADGGEHYGVATLAFDIEEELLWMGNQGGHVTSYYGTDMQKYTSFQVHANEEVRQILTTEIGVLALTSSSLRGQMRRGIPLFTHCSENMVEMQCMLQTTPSTLLMAGHQDKLIEFDLTEGVETNYVDVGENGCAILRPHSRFICAGDPSGRICLRDPNSLSLEHTLETHSASLSDFDVHGNLLVTCGFSNRQGALTVDRFLMVYDLRMLRAVSPIPVVLDPLLLRFMPSLSSRLAVVSVSGQLQLADTVSLSTPNLSLYQVNMGGSMCLSLDVSSSCQSLAIGDNGGVIHLFTQNAAVFNTFSRPTEFADTPHHVEPFAIDDESAVYANIPLQHPATGTKLLSDWPAECLKKVYRPTPPIDPEILKSMKMQDTIGYAPNPMTRRRNQVCYKLGGSGRRNAQNGHGPGDSRGKPDEAGFIAIPWRYRKVDIKYSRLGQEDFDFEQYNSTAFSGLEASLQNSYSNAMLQVLYFIEPLRRLLLSHLCQKEFCLACELGFLFYMLDSAKGFPCQAANFQRAFRTVPEAYGLGLLLSDQNTERKTNLIRLIQSWNRFILHQIHREFLESQKQQQIEEQSQFVFNENDFPAISRRDNNVPTSTAGASKSTEETDNSSGRNDDTTFISNLLGSRQSLTHRCFKCGHEVVKESVVLLCNLVYPTIDEKSDPSDYEFPSVLAQSLCPKKTTPAWCDQCAKFQPTEHLRGIQQLPQILSVNCGMDTEQDINFWKAQIDSVTKRPMENTASVHSPGRPCRYGSLCSRPNCRFRHPAVAPGERSDAPTTNQKQHPNSKSWLPHAIRLERMTSGAVRASSVDAQPQDDDDVAETIIYDLTAVICHISDERKNVVALINVGPSYFERTGHKPRTNWYIFNDFSVTPVPQQEAVWFSLDWKVPCVLYWTNREIPEDVTPPVINPITAEVFREDNSLARNNGARKMITFTPLMPDEMPAPGELVAMDAEFVTLNQEEAELRSDGKVSTVKPSHKSVARITCVRGQGPLEGTPFIDDYISTQEQVVDYLTKFSGIEPGDLDANFSSKHLTTLKSTYQKLRFLIDNGVKFVGHGLKNDFRVINLTVPPEQIADTVLLFNLPNHRLVSLRFLSWHFLGVTIQSGSHDSIEDARAALQLYRHYQQLEAEGKVQEALLDLYQTGNAMQWTVPGENVN